MKKLRLDPENVQVESFLTSMPGSGMPGTVRAKSDTYLWCNSYQETCWNMGCNTGVTGPQCPTSEAETCNGWPGCPATGQNSEYTCEGTCSDYGCTVCNAWC
jgi:hypothetical protein